MLMFLFSPAVDFIEPKYNEKIGIFTARREQQMQLRVVIISTLKVYIVFRHFPSKPQK